MNKQYTYIDGNVIIVDDKDNTKKDEYYDNLDKVLVQENVIETMENKYQELTKQGTRKPNNKIYIPSTFLTCVPIATFGIPTVFLLPEFRTLFTEIFNKINCPIDPTIVIGLFSGGVSSAFSMAVEVKMYKGYKKENGIDSQIEFLQRQIPIEKEDLENLKSVRTRENENTKFRTIKVDDSQQLKALNSCLDLFFDLGYNGNKYYQYYQQGKLDRKLQKSYTDTGIQLAKEYFEEKGPVYSKKRTSHK